MAVKLYVYFAGDFTERDVATLITEIKERVEMAQLKGDTGGSVVTVAPAYEKGGARPVFVVEHRATLTEVETVELIGLLRAAVVLGREKCNGDL